MSLAERLDNLPHLDERIDLAAAFRWIARLDMHEGVANHFSLAVSDDGAQFLVNPRHKHFSRVKASDLILIDANDPSTLDRPDAPDPTAWGLHGAVHRLCPHARCAMHVHSIHATVLACLEDPILPPLDQNACMFYGRQAIDPDYGGLALTEEAERACAHLSNAATSILVMGNHGVMAVGPTVAETLTRLYYFERAAEIYVKTLWTGRPMRILPDHVAAKTAEQLNSASTYGEDYLREIRAILDEAEPDYAD